MNDKATVADLERSLAARYQELAVLRQKNITARIADLEYALLERDKEITWLRDMLVNQPKGGRIAMISTVAGDENYPNVVYVLTAEGEVWEGTWRLPDHKFSWERIPDLPEEAR